MSFSQLKDTLEDAHSLPDFLRNVARLLGAIPQGYVSEVALDVANLTGLGPCVNLMSKVITHSTSAPPPVVGHGGSVGGGGNAGGGSATPGDIVDVATGNQISCAVLRSGGVYCWGINNNGALGDGQDLGPETCGNPPSSPAEPCSRKPVEVVGLTDATSVAVGNGYACALIAGGTVECWGYGTPALVPTP